MGPTYPLRCTNMQFIPTGDGRVDWQSAREQVDLAAVATGLLGPAQGRRGERGRRLWWPCPFHEDRNPSFCVDPGKPWWRCFGCGEHGDAAALVMRLEGKTFPEAIALLTGESLPSWKPRRRPVVKPKPEPPPEPSGLPEAAALALVEAAAARLWSPEGAEALAYLTGPRCLSPETVRAARLGWTPGASVPTRAGDRSYQAVGWVVPWFASGRLMLVKVRQPDGRHPKYVEAFRDPARLVCYPGPETVRPGRPLVIPEGEFDALCLGQALGELAAVVTLGSASARPEPSILGTMLAATPWFIATDQDEAGDRSAAGWPASARRVRPPGPYKDWTEAARDGVNLRRWWGDRLGGNEAPPLFTWDELSSWRWGGADASPGIDNPGRRPGRDTLARALDPEADPYTAAEREAIQAANDPVGV